MSKHHTEKIAQFNFISLTHKKDNLVLMMMALFGILTTSMKPVGGSNYGR